MSATKAPFRYRGTTSLVTGASSGLGAEFARQLAARGSDLILVARSADRMTTFADELRSTYHVDVTTVPADLSVADDVGRVVELAASTPVHLLVNNAGFGSYGDFAGLDATRERAQVMVNVAAVVDLAHSVLPGMLSRRAGGIITIASTIAFQPSPLQAVYGASKAFDLAFSEALWAETRGSGVRIVALCPGPTATGYLAGLGDDRATTSRIYRHAGNPADVVRAGLSGLDRDDMTVIPGLRNRVIAEGYRFFPRTVMARVSGRMLSPGRPST